MISRDAAKVSIDFTFDTDPENEENNIAINLRYHYTEEFGETISILNHAMGVIQLPAKMFGEATDYLREQGRLVSKNAIVAASPKQRSFGAPKLSATQVNKTANAGFVQQGPPRQSSIQRPAPQRQPEAVAEVEPEHVEYEFDHEAAPLQSFMSSPKRGKGNKGPKPITPGRPVENLDDAGSEDVDPEFSLQAAKIKKEMAPPPRRTLRANGKKREKVEI